MVAKILISSFLMFSFQALSSTCKVEMTDNLNLNDGKPSVSYLTATILKKDTFRTYYDLNASDVGSRKATLDYELNLIVTNPGVPDTTIDELKRDYRMRDDSQLTFTVLTPKECDETTRALIYFFVVEWFYFG